MVIPLSGPSPSAVAKEKRDADIYAKYQNIRYRGMTVQESMMRLTDIPVLARPSTLPSNDFSKEDKRAHYKLALANPEYILSKLNAAEVKDYIQNGNGISGNYMDDPGHGYFEFEPEYPDSVQVVKNSVQAAENRANRFWIGDRTKPPLLTNSELSRLRRRT